MLRKCCIVFPIVLGGTGTHLELQIVKRKSQLSLLQYRPGSWWTVVTVFLLSVQLCANVAEMMQFCCGLLPRWRSGKGVRLESGRSRVRIPLAPRFVRGRVIHTSDLKLALQWLPCQAPGVLGSVLGLAGPVSVYCDWVTL